jgi:putative nucleotidyltransferase with HDIG domain
MDSMGISASELIKDIKGLITLPDVYLRITKLIDDPKSSAADIAKAIAQDPSFTIRLLRVANSALYRFPSKVDTVARAVTIIGTSQVCNLALSMSVASSFDGMLNELVSMANFWRHSLLCALTSRHLSGLAGRCDRDAMFTAGLLHDIGELVIFNRLPEQARDALLLVLDSQDEIPVYLAERQVIGFDHSEVGGELAKQWNLPALLEECIAHHHDIANAKRHPREAAILHLGNVLALMAEVDDLEPGGVATIDPLSWQLTGLTADCIEPVVRDVQSELAEVERLFLDRK